MLVEITLAKGVITPEELPLLLGTVAAQVPEGGTDGVVLSGRMPVWAFAALAHMFHPRPYVATFEPRVGKGIVVASHAPGYRPGDMVDVTGTTVSVTFGGTFGGENA